MGCKDRWKSRVAGFPRLRLGTNGKPWSTKISKLIFVIHGFPLFQAIQSNQFLEYPWNPCVQRSRTRVQEILWGRLHSRHAGPVRSLKSCLSCLIIFPVALGSLWERWRDPFKVRNKVTTLSGGNWLSSAPIFFPGTFLDMGMGYDLFPHEGGRGFTQSTRPNSTKKIIKSISCEMLDSHR